MRRVSNSQMLCGNGSVCVNSRCVLNLFLLVYLVYERCRLVLRINTSKLNILHKLFVS